MANTYTDEVFKIRKWPSAETARFRAPEKAVLMALAFHADGNTGSCFPSHELLAEETFTSVATVTRAVAKLKGQRFFTVDHESRNSNTYSLNLERIKEVAALAPKRERKQGKRDGDSKIAYKGNKYFKREKSPALPPPSNTRDEFD
ncbi:MAG: helix-turn-helix domain-containing protein [Terracidiphilus sp.]